MADLRLRTQVFVDVGKRRITLRGMTGLERAIVRQCMRRQRLPIMDARPGVVRKFQPHKGETVEERIDRYHAEGFA